MGIGRYYYLILLLAPILFSISMMDGVYAMHVPLQDPDDASAPDSVSGNETGGQINELKAEIEFLKEELAKKNAVLLEQLRVISDLANMIKNAIYEQFVSLFIF